MGNLQKAGQGGIWRLSLLRPMSQKPLGFLDSRSCLGPAKVFVKAHSLPWVEVIHFSGKACVHLQCFLFFFLSSHIYCDSLGLMRRDGEYR